MGIGVKVATLPVIALGVGVGVDYALYLLSIQLAIQRRGGSLREAYTRSLEFTGKVVALVGATMAAGVVTWAWSPIKFQADMGILLTFMFLWNMIGALVLIPALSHFLLRDVGAKGVAPRTPSHFQGAGTCALIFPPRMKPSAWRCAPSSASTCRVTWRAASTSARIRRRATTCGASRALLHGRGWGAPHWPEEWGGTGWSPLRKHLFMEELYNADGLDYSWQGLHMVAPVLVRLRLRGAEATLPAADDRRRRVLGPGLFRAERRLGPREPEDAGGARWRRMGRQRPEDLDQRRA